MLALFRRHIHEAIELVQNREPEDRIVFVKSWNEWAEGNYLEPDLKFGHQYLDVVRETAFPRSETLIEASGRSGFSTTDTMYR